MSGTVITAIIGKRRMKQTISSRFRALLALVFFAAPLAHAQLVVEITRGQANAIPIAVVPFGWEGTGTVPFDVAQIIAGDLARSGRFAPLERRDMIDRPTVGSQIKFQDWRYLKPDAAPPDIRSGAAHIDPHMPSALRVELRRPGLL